MDTPTCYGKYQQGRAECDGGLSPTAYDQTTGSHRFPGCRFKSYCIERKNTSMVPAQHLTSTLPKLSSLSAIPSSAKLPALANLRTLPSLNTATQKLPSLAGSGLQGTAPARHLQPQQAPQLQMQQLQAQQMQAQQMQAQQLQMQQMQGMNYMPPITGYYVHPGTYASGNLSVPEPVGTSHMQMVLLTFLRAALKAGFQALAHLLDNMPIGRL